MKCFQSKLKFRKISVRCSLHFKSNLPEQFSYSDQLTDKRVVMTWKNSLHNVIFQIVFRSEATSVYFLQNNFNITQLYKKTVN